jgi:hypothetical protein
LRAFLLITNRVAEWRIAIRCREILHTREFGGAGSRAFLLIINRLSELAWILLGVLLEAIEQGDWEMRIISRARAAVSTFLSGMTVRRLALAVSLGPVTPVTGTSSAYAGTPGNAGLERQVQRPGRLGEG